MSRPREGEKPILELESRLEDIERSSRELGIELPAEYHELRERLEELCRKLQDELTPWDRVLISRHPERPQSRSYIDHMCDEWLELSGDRLGGDDRAVIAGLGRIDGRLLVIVGTQKGTTTRERMERNFGMPGPAGYRKAKRCFRLAERFGLPLLTLIDLQGADPGMSAEERGQSWAISDNLAVLSELRTPIVSVIIGEAGSGGALALAVGDSLAMLENAYYSVITPEGCATILWKDAGRAAEAAGMLKLTAADALSFGIIDAVVPEPPCGAHREPEKALQSVSDHVRSRLAELSRQPVEELVEKRYERLRRIGRYAEVLPQE